MPVGGVTGWVEGSPVVGGGGIADDDGDASKDGGGMEVVAWGGTSDADVVAALVMGVDDVSSTARGGFVEEVHPENQPSARREGCRIDLERLVKRGIADLVRLYMLTRLCKIQIKPTLYSRFNMTCATFRLSWTSIVQRSLARSSVATDIRVVFKSPNPQY